MTTQRATSVLQVPVLNVGKNEKENGFRWMNVKKLMLLYGPALTCPYFAFDFPHCTKTPNPSYSHPKFDARTEQAQGKTKISCVLSSTYILISVVVSFEWSEDELVFEFILLWKDTGVLGAVRIERLLFIGVECSEDGNMWCERRGVECELKQSAL